MSRGIYSACSGHEPALDRGRGFQQSSGVAQGDAGRDKRMTGFRSALLLLTTLVVWSEGSAAADEPQPASAEPAPQADPSVTDAAPSPTIPAAPAPPQVPAPLVTPPPAAAPSGGVPAEGGAADPDAWLRSVREPRFGDAGQVTLNGALNAGFGRLGYESGNSSSTTFGVEPAFDYFAAQDFSQGATAFFRYNNTEAGTGIQIASATLGVSGRIGRNFWLGQRVSFWPKLAVGVWRSWLTYSSTSPGARVSVNGTAVPIGSSTKLTEDAAFIEIQMPFLFHLAQHFFIGIGPNAYVDVLHTLENSSNRRRFVGVLSTVGGWF